MTIKEDFSESGFAVMITCGRRRGWVVYASDKWGHAWMQDFIECKTVDQGRQELRDVYPNVLANSSDYIRVTEDVFDGYCRLQRRVAGSPEIVETHTSNNNIVFWRRGDSYPESWPQWLREANVEWCQVEVKDDGVVVWHDGVWRSGCWHKGVWRNGVWYGGEWCSGIWHAGEWRKGYWHDGSWHAGEWHDGYWDGGEWLDGVWRDGYWNSGIWSSGIWYDGVWRKGHWHDGVWRDGRWYYGCWDVGEWRNGVWLGGSWYDGFWHYGCWHDGSWHDGVWHNGFWHGGVWRDGDQWRTDGPPAAGDLET